MQRNEHQPDDLISTFKVAKHFQKVAAITGRKRAARGLCGPTWIIDGRLMVSLTELRKRGIVSAEPLPAGPTVDAYEVAREIFDTINAAWPDDRATRLTVVRALWPALTKLVPITAEEIEGLTEGECKEGNNPSAPR